MLNVEPIETVCADRITRFLSTSQFHNFSKFLWIGAYGFSMVFY